MIRAWLHWVILVFLFVTMGCSGKTSGQGENDSQDLQSPTVTETKILPISKDNSIVDYQDERHVNMGAATNIRIKTYQHHLVLDADTSAIQGQKVVGATLRYGRNKHDLEHVTLSSIQGNWVEGTSGGFSVQEGSSCFLAAQYHDDASTLIPWSFPGSRYVDVVYGNGHSLMGYSHCPQIDGYYEWTVPADIVNALTVGASYGIAVFESSHRVDRNPTVYSRESAMKPELVVITQAGDPAPSALTSLTASQTGVDRGQVKLTWTVPEHAFAYHLSIEGGQYTAETSVPRYLIPFADSAGNTQELVLKDILTPGTTYTLSMVAVSRGGAQSPPYQISITASAIDSYPHDTVEVAEPSANGSGFSSGGLTVFAIPVTDKITPDGELLESVPYNYTTLNSVFYDDTITLRGGLNDILSFQLVLKDSGTAISDIAISVTIPELISNLDRVGFINTDDGMMAELLRGSAASYGTRMDENASTQQAQAILVEIQVPDHVTAGTKTGSIDLTGSFGSLSIPLALHIENFLIPDKPTFKCEMNDYGYPNYLATFNELQTVARRFRSHVNLLPYSQSGRTRMDMYFPGSGQMNESAYNDFMAGDTTGHWTDFTTGFDPLFDATLYDSGPWDSAPIPGFYLTFHESWPLLAEDFYADGSKDAYEAFSSSYEDTFKDVLSDFVTHAKTNQWTDTGFQVYLNNKPHGDHYTIGSGSTPWTLDEPVNFWDFRALGYYGQLFKEGAGDHAPIDIKYRIDVSRYPYHRGQLDGLVDLAVVNRDLYIFKRLIFNLAKKDAIDIWNYGTGNQIPNSNISAPGWVLSCYAMGATGVLPWSTVKYVSQDYNYLYGVTGNDRQQRALFVVAEDDQSPVIYPSLRLAAFRQAALDAEYLAILKELGGYTQGQMERLINHYLDLDSAFSISSSYSEDAGTISFDDLTSTQLWQLRTHVLDSIRALTP